MHKPIISRALSKPNANVFDEIISSIEYEFTKPVTSITEMKERDNKKRKGDIWELFSRDWLLASDTYVNVWLLSDYISIYPNSFLTKQDNGIDLIGKTTNGMWHAIQCKYRSGKSRVDWKSLSTFIALCERSKSPDGTPWDKHVVVTNCASVTHKLPKTSKDKSICLRSLRNTKRDHWLKIINKENTHSLIETQHNNGVYLNIIRNELTPTELRNRRLQHFT